MRYKKIIIVVVVLVFFLVSIFMIYNINTVFPSAVEKAYRVGDTTRYKGLKLTVGDVEIYTEEEIMEKYPDIQSGLEKERYVNDKSTYIIANFTLENDTDEAVSFGKLDHILYWVIETNMDRNGASPLFFQLNPEFDSSFSSGEVQEIKLLYQISEVWTSYEEIIHSDKKIVFSYYPTKSYLLYKGEK